MRRRPERQLPDSSAISPRLDGLIIFYRFGRRRAKERRPGLPISDFRLAIEARVMEGVFVFFGSPPFDKLTAMPSPFPSPTGRGEGEGGGRQTAGGWCERFAIAGQERAQRLAILSAPSRRRAKAAMATARARQWIATWRKPVVPGRKIKSSPRRGRQNKPCRETHRVIQSPAVRRIRFAIALQETAQSLAIRRGRRALWS